MSTPRVNLRRGALLASLLLACAGGDGSDGGGGLSQGNITDFESGAATTSDSDSEPGPTGTSGTTGTSNASGTTATTATTATDATTGMVSASDGDTTAANSSEPPPDCGPLTLCGVQCVDLSADPTNCGKCGISCVIPHASAGCAASSCAITSCDPGWFDCDQDLQTGCEQTLGPGEQCMPVCKPGNPELCNLFDDDCDGSCDEGAIAGCRQGVHRAISPTQGHFYTLDAAEAMSGDFTPEFLNFYYLHVEPQPGLVPFYRCLKGDGRRFYTTSAACEGAGPVEGVMGQIGTEAFCGAIPLYRLVGNQEHFYTTSAPERDNAVTNLGYVFEGQVGFVWPGP